MAANILSLTIFSLVLISANGRSLQKGIEGKNVNLSRSILVSSTSINGKLNAVSRATASSYTMNVNDVKGLNLIVTLIPSLKEDDGNPCLWTWIECSSDPTPRVIALDLSENLLIGNIPSFFSTFRDLIVLNLAYNALSGVVPNSLACNKNLNLITTGNVGLIYNTCSSSSSSGTSPGNGNSISSEIDGFQVPASSRRTKKKSNLPLILGDTIPAVVLIWVAIGAYAMYRQRANAAAASSTEQGPTADIIPHGGKAHERYP